MRSSVASSSWCASSTSAVWLLLFRTYVRVRCRSTIKAELWRSNRQESFGADWIIVPCQVPRNRAQALCDLARLLDSCWWSSWGWVEMQSVFVNTTVTCTIITPTAPCVFASTFWVTKPQSTWMLVVQKNLVVEVKHMRNENTDTFFSIPLTAIEQNLLLLFPIFPARDRKIRCSVFRVISTLFQRIHSCNSNRVRRSQDTRWSRRCCIPKYRNCQEMWTDLFSVNRRGRGTMADPKGTDITPVVRSSTANGHFATDPLKNFANSGNQIAAALTASHERSTTRFISKRIDWFAKWEPSKHVNGSWVKG